jgi:hypothetical protein
VNNGGLAQFIDYQPVYTDGVLAAPTTSNTNQTLSSVITGNVALQSSYQTSNNRTTSLNSNYLQVWMNTANSMTNSDRIRSGNFISEAKAVGGQVWGSNTAQPTNTSIMGVSGVGMFTGNGTATSVVGMGGFAQMTPAAGGQYVRTATGVIGAVNFNTGGTGRGPVYVETARSFGAFQSGASGNIVVNTAIGLHTHSGWATATTKYSLLNEDATSTIQTNGPVVISNTATITGNVSLNGNISTSSLGFVTHRERILGLGNQSGTLTIVATNAPVQTMTATGNITINSISGILSGQSVTLIIQQDSTGSRLLSSTMLFAGGAKTLSTAAFATDVINIFYDGSNHLASLVKGYA